MIPAAGFLGGLVGITHVRPFGLTEEGTQIFRSELDTANTRRFSLRHARNGRRDGRSDAARGASFAAGYFNHLMSVEKFRTVRAGAELSIKIFIDFLEKSGYNESMKLTEFTFLLRKPDGQEYEQDVPARSQAEAERRLMNLLDALSSYDKIIGFKGSHNDTQIAQ